MIKVQAMSSLPRSFMYPTHLLHLTNSVENIESILEWGLLFTYNPTEVLEQLLGEAFTKTSAPAPGGMVCFTALPYQKTKNIFQEKRYGISVDVEWAKSVGARPVMYVNPAKETVFSQFRDTHFDRLVKALPRDMKSSQHLERWLIELGATNSNFAKSLGLDEEFLRFQKQILWMQTEGHRVEQEWRIRSPRGYPNIEIFSDKKEQVELLLRMVKNIPSTRQLIALKIPPEVVEGIFVPAGRANTVRSIAKKFGYAGNCVNIP